jgi:hypothetical protein
VSYPFLQRSLFLHTPSENLATSESNRAIPPYQSGPYDRMGRGHREEDGGVEPYGVTRREGSSPAAAPVAHLHPPRAEGAVIETDGRNRASLSGRARPLAGSPSVPNRGFEPRTS